jgi:hypothetical protein
MVPVRPNPAPITCIGLVFLNGLLRYRRFGWRACNQHTLVAPHFHGRGQVGRANLVAFVQRKIASHRPEVYE